MINTALEKILRDEIRLQERRLREIKKGHSGKLHVRQKGDKHFFWEYKDGKQIGLTKNDARINQLARQDFLEAEKETGEKSLRILEKANASILKLLNCSKTKAVLKKYEMLDVNSIKYSAEELEWIRNRQSQNPYRREDLRYKTSQGVAMRSKSERLIGNFLEERGLLYKYEAKVIIDGREYFPDFIVLSRSNHKIIWEHCGLMDNVEYFYKMVMKMNEYRKRGFVWHRNLICTYEEDLQNMDTLEEIFEKFL